MAYESKMKAPNAQGADISVVYNVYSLGARMV
jgi:hypothetical protein